MFSNNLIAGAAGQSTGFYPVSIDQSLRFNDDDSAYLDRSVATSGDLRKWTVSCWVKRGALGGSVDRYLFTETNEDGSGANIKYTIMRFTTADKLELADRWGSSPGDEKITTTAVFRDPSAWYHVVFVRDSDNATAADRAIIYVNGVRQEVTGSFTQSKDSSWNKQTTAAYGQEVSGRFRFAGSWYYGSDFYLAEVHSIDGTAYTADDFGELKNGVWVAKTPSVTYGTNGFYLDFATSGDGTTEDVSGNGNNWTENNITASDVVLDSPTDNFATFNPLHGGNGCTLSDGNLKVVTPDNKSVGTTAALTSGKWYAEATINAANYSSVGICRDDEVFGTNLNASGEAWMYSYVGTVYKKSSSDTTPASYTTNDVISFYLDLDNNKLYIYKNNSGITTSEGTHSVGSTGISIDSGYGYYFCTTANGNNGENTWNFGQQDYTYTPADAGYLALSTANLPDPVIDPAQDASPSDYFNTVLWTGTGNVGTRAISGVGFQPDFVWYKGRSYGGSHQLHDVARGAGTKLFSNLNYAETSSNVYGTLTSFDSDGFTGTQGSSDFQEFNNSGSTFVAWNWKANGSGVSNEVGGTSSIVSVNTEAGISVVSYTGAGASTIGHGLGAVPEMIIVKRRNTTENWGVYHQAMGATNALYLDGTNAPDTSSVYWNNTAPTTDVFSVGAWGGSGASGGTFIAYCFAPIDGFSRFDSYVGNGSTDGTFVYTGFRPAFIMTKRLDSTGTWYMNDSARSPSNPTSSFGANLYADLSNTEGGNGMDILSNGFKLRNTDSSQNASGGTYIYMAFAENPFKYSNAR